MSTGLFPTFEKDEIVKPLIALILNLWSGGLGTCVAAFLPKTGLHQKTLIIGILQLVVTWGLGVMGGIIGTMIIIGFWLYAFWIVGYLWALIWSIMMIVNCGKAPSPITVQPVAIPPAGPNAEPYTPPQPQYAQAPQPQ